MSAYKHDPNLGPVARTAGRGLDDLNISFEFFPPKTEKMQKTLWDSIQRLEPLAPDFVSVTYGAGGSTRERTHETVAKIARDTSLSAAAHLTCVGSSKTEIEDIARAYWDAGVRHIVALRGDPEAGIGERYQPMEGGYAYGSDLVAGLKSIAPFEISVSAYPELHPESRNLADEIDNLKRKVDAGADRAITQFFFTPDVFLRFRDQVAQAGVDIPIVPGLMLQPNYKGMKRMADMCKISIPDWYHRLFDGLDDEPEIRTLLTASTTAEMVAKLQEAGVNHFHFYTLNKADLAMTVCKMLGRSPRAKADA
ncbi:MAG TPA: methylenetetrahydrofolate reductase [NAD(P)H] [Hellea balneolensis]|uniref:Methylenetetrahydrofolate reductase n=1 Tax=Hellea balneolensis TaxID=287478 RepID=A0A7C5LWC2_9PROT|nr:methylenetetrahydrofolate reductase [NAD(P)H] [Hellea balneolensis]